MIKKFKKLGIVVAVLLLTICLVACGSDSSENSEDPSSGESEEAQEETVYKVGDTWEVDGQWKFTVDSVESTDERNEFDDSDPAQVIVINYSYENIGYEDSTGLMDGLYMQPEQIIDSDGTVCTEYPIDYEYAQETPVGAKCSASIAFGLKSEGSPVTMNISLYDGNEKEQKATYELEF